MDVASRIPRVSPGRPLRVDPARRAGSGSNDATDRTPIAPLPALVARKASEEPQGPVFHAATFVAQLLAGYDSLDGDRRRASAPGMSARASARYLAGREAPDRIGPGFLAERLV